MLSDYTKNLPKTAGPKNLGILPSCPWLELLIHLCLGQVESSPVSAEDQRGEVQILTLAGLYFFHVGLDKDDLLKSG